MLFSKACEYGIRATIYIATQSKQNQRVSLVEIATEIDSPKSFTAKILQKLARNKVIVSIKGQTGGYEIPKEDMEKITLGKIVAAIDGTEMYTVCGLGLKKCSEKQPCPVHANFKVIREKVRKTLDNTTLEMLTSGVGMGETYLKL